MSCFCGFRLEPEVEISNSVAQILYLSVYLSDISFNLSPLPLGWLLFFISFQFTALVQYISSRCWQACFFFSLSTVLCEVFSTETFPGKPCPPSYLCNTPPPSKYTYISKYLKYLCKKIHLSWRVSPGAFVQYKLTEPRETLLCCF